MSELSDRILHMEKATEIIRLRAENERLQGLLNSQEEARESLALARAHD